MTVSDLVHVIGDDVVVRRSLAFLLASDGHLFRLYESAFDFFDAVGHLSSGCIVSDVTMPVMDGLELLRRTTASKDLRIPVIMIAGNADIKMAVQAMRLGAFEFIEKPFDDQSFLTSVRSALSFKKVSNLRAGDDATLIVKKVAQLTQRERQVFEDLLVGSSNKVIAQNLGISPRTVEIHRANVMSKMEAGSLSHLVRMGLACREASSESTSWGICSDCHAGVSR